MKTILAPKLKRGGTIGVFSSSYPITAYSPKSAQCSLQFIEKNGYHVKKGKLWGNGNYYRSGTALQRAEEFNELLYDPEVDCLMASIGGYVSNSMLPYIDYEYFAANPKPVVGMSDVTSLLMGLYAKTGVTVYYGTNFVTSYTRLSPYREIALKCFIDVLNERDRYVYKMPKFYSDEIIDWNSPPADEKCISNSMVTLKGGRVQGRLIGGNMNTLTSVWGTPYMPEICDGDILFLENTEEWAGFTERYVMWLKLCGVFERIGGLIIGKHRAFDDCGIGKQSYEILNETIGELHFPVLAEFDCSHCAPMLTLPIGVMAELDADAQTLTLLY